jgi:hypothetical protein
LLHCRQIKKAGGGAHGGCQGSRALGQRHHVI